MILLETNRPEYRNDIAEEIRLFFGQTEIVLAGEENGGQPELSISVQLAAAPGCATATAKCSGAMQSETIAFDGADHLTVKRFEKRAVKIAVFRLLQQLFPRVIPWGSLTGIRPTKLFRELTVQSGAEAARDAFLRLYDVTPDKIRLAESICEAQRDMIASVGERDFDVYVNIPFCPTKCLYCSFPSQILGKEDALTPYLEKLFIDISEGAALMRERGYRLRCMYVGGGTPTVLSTEQLDRLISTLKICYGSLGNEITVEAGRPDTITEDKLLVLREHGVQRISINPQSMNDDTLCRIGRAHTADDVERAFSLARSIGFPVINMDLIAGLPGEHVDDFCGSLQRVQRLSPANMTVHTLAIKRSSRLIERLDEYPLPTASDVEQMLSAGAETAQSLGMQPYYMYRQKYMSGNLENVGYAKQDSICMYNIDMMEETTNIMAHGASAMSKRVFGYENRVERIPNPKDVKTYFDKLPTILLEKRALFD